MPNLPFTLRQLEVFSALSAMRSFRRTAEHLGISQAAVSNQIRALEEQLGLALLLRVSGKQPMLTPEGLAFLDDLATFHSAAEALAAHRRPSLARKERLSLRIRAGQGLVDNYIRPKLDRFLAENSEIGLEFDAKLPSDSIGRDVEMGQYDFALVHLRADHAVAPIFHQIALLRGGIYGHRKFADSATLPLTAERVGGLPFILPGEGSAQEQEVHVALRREGIVPRKVISHTQYFDVMANMLEQGLGVASFSEVILPPRMRETVILLYPLTDWRLLWYRRDKGVDERYDKVEQFLLSSLLDDPEYCTIQVLDA
jgi:DNA-binding transcriptional LysR family regulator